MLTLCTHMENISLLFFLCHLLAEAHYFSHTGVLHNSASQAGS